MNHNNHPGRSRRERGGAGASGGGSRGRPGDRRAGGAPAWGHCPASASRPWPEPRRDRSQARHRPSSLPPPSRLRGRSATIAGPGRLLAAVLACGDDAPESPQCRRAVGAAPLRRLPSPCHGGPPRPQEPSRHLRTQFRRPHAENRAERSGIPLTSVARTLLDLAQNVRQDQLERAFEQAERLRLLDLSAVARLCERSNGHRGLTRLRPLVAQAGRPVTETRSELERRFLRLCDDAGLPRLR